MAHKKQGGGVAQGVSPSGKRLGVKVSNGERVSRGSILVRQRGTELHKGQGVGKGKDHTLYAVKDGIVKFVDNKSRKEVWIVSN